MDRRELGGGNRKREGKKNCGWYAKYMENLIKKGIQDMRLKKMTYNLEYNYLKRQFSYVSKKLFAMSLKARNPFLNIFF